MGEGDGEGVGNAERKRTQAFFTLSGFCCGAFPALKKEPGSSQSALQSPTCVVDTKSSEILLLIPL